MRELPAEAETASHQLMLRAGMIQQVAAGVYCYLPLAWRALRKMEDIIREEMDAAGGQEISMPVLQPMEIWEESGRDHAFGRGLFTLKDRRDRWLALGPTHEEVVTDLARRFVKSYRDLPVMLYQIQTKFRDEPRPRGGLIRVREFTMKDLYSFDLDEKGLDVSYERMKLAYMNVYRRCGLDAIMVEADSGAIGGKDSHEFMVIAETGEDEIIFCGKCGYAANAEKAVSSKPAGSSDEQMLPLDEVSTPGCKTIEEVASFLGVPKEKTLKAVFYSVDGSLVFAVIRGDLEVNEVKVKNALKCADLRLANDEELRAKGVVAGSASAVGMKDVKVVADESIKSGNNFVVGANKADCHLKNANYLRDFDADVVTDIALARAGEGCPHCGAELQSTRGVEVGHIFKLGTVFSERQGALYLDQDGAQKPMVMGCYGIGVGRLLAAAIEQNHDEKGIRWPAPIAPFDVYLCVLGGDEPEVMSAAESACGALEARGLDLVFDDRAESPGVKFNDADLMGMPVRVVVSKRSLKSGGAEVKLRRGSDVELVPMDELADRVEALLAG